MKKMVVLAMVLSVNAWAQVKPGAGTSIGTPSTPASRTPAVVESNRATPAPAPTTPATSPTRRPRTTSPSTGSTTLATPRPLRKDFLEPRCVVFEVFTRPLILMQGIPTAGLEISDYNGKTTVLMEYAFGQVLSLDVLGYPEGYLVRSWMIGGRWYAQCAEGRFASVRLRARTYTLPSQLDQIDGMYNLSILGGYKKKISAHFYVSAEIGLCLTSVEAFTYFDQDGPRYRNPAGVGIPSALGMSFRF